jgi:type I restriction enzyme S subunit
LALVRPDKTKVNPRFFHYYFLSPLWRAHIESNIISGATVDRIPLTRFPDFQISIPELEIQDRIASILSAYDDLIENNRRRIQLLELSALLLYKEWFVHLRFPGHEHLKITDGVPEGWKEVTVGELGEVVTGKTPPTKDPDNYGGNIPFIKTPDMHNTPIVIATDQNLSEKGTKTQENKYIPKGSIMVSCIGTVGVVAVNAYEAHTNQQINTVIPREKHFRYYCYFALSGLRQRLEAMGGGATMSNVNKSKFISLPILVPKGSILRIFDEFCRPLFSHIEGLLLQNKKLREARNLLLPRIMNGDIPV